jgi:hypothetical protein
VRRARHLVAVALAPLLLCGAYCARPAPLGAPGDAKAACGRLSLYGCAIGLDAECVAVLEAAPVDEHTTAQAIACVAHSPNKAAAVACDPSFFTCP